MFALRKAAAVLMLFGSGAMSPAFAQVTWNQVKNFKAPAENSAYASELLGKTNADECFNGVGIDYPPVNPDGTCSIGQPKRNQSYVWGLAQAGVGDTSFTGDQIWFGTVANPICGGSATGLFPPQPNVTLSWVCEYGSSEGARRPSHPLPASLGDWRMPHAYSYNMALRQLTDRTPNDRSSRRFSACVPPVLWATCPSSPGRRSRTTSRSPRGTPRPAPTSAHAARPR